MSPKEQRSKKQYLNVVSNGNFHLPVWNPYQKYLVDDLFPMLSNIQSVLQR